jgi:hypothetical protein
VLRDWLSLPLFTGRDVEHISLYRNSMMQPEFLRLIQMGGSNQRVIMASLIFFEEVHLQTNSYPLSDPLSPINPTLGRVIAGGLYRKAENYQDKAAI